MSAYVVTETGVVIEYPRAGWISWESDKNYIAVLYERKDGNGELKNFIARVPRGCVVSFHRPGVVKQAADARRMSLEDSLELTVACVRTLESRESITKDVARCLAASGCRSGERVGDIRGQDNVVASRMVAFGEYVNDGVVSTVKERDHKDATDLIAFSSKDCGSDAAEISPTLRSMN